MSENYNPVNEVYICSCGSIEHSFVLRIWDFGVDGKVSKEDPDSNAGLSLEIFLSDAPFWYRLWNGIRYIFGYKCRFGHFQSADLSYDDAWNVIVRLAEYRKLVKKYRDMINPDEKETINDVQDH